MQIVELRAENVKRIKAVKIRPDGNLIVIGGKNAAGKSTVLDCIMYALGGKDVLPDKPLREGTEKGSTYLDLGELRVTRTLTKAGGTLKVTAPDGGVYPSPQKMLSDLLDPLSFDPIAFSRMDAKKQTETLRALLGLDFAAMDRQRLGFFDERTGTNRDAKRLADQLEGMPNHADAPAQEVSVASITDELDAASLAEESLAGLRAQQTDETSNVYAARERIETIEAKIQDLRNRIGDLQAEHGGKRDSIAASNQRFDALAGSITEAEASLPDRNDIRDRILNAENDNGKVRENADYAVVEMKLEESRKKTGDLTLKIEAIDKAKRAKIEDAKYPIDGLGFGEDGVSYGGLPFSQASSAEQLRVSVAMGLAMNPKLRVLLIRDGSLLDEDGLRLIAEMATEAKAQVFLERVGEGEETSIVIEDGSVKGAAEEGADG